MDTETIHCQKVHKKVINSSTGNIIFHSIYNNLLKFLLFNLTRFTQRTYNTHSPLNSAQNASKSPFEKRPLKNYRYGNKNVAFVEIGDNHRYKSIVLAKKRRRLLEAVASYRPAPEIMTRVKKIHDRNSCEREPLLSCTL